MVGERWKIRWKARLATALAVVAATATVLTQGHTIWDNVRPLIPEAVLSRFSFDTAVDRQLSLILLGPTNAGMVERQFGKPITERKLSYYSKVKIRYFENNDTAFALATLPDDSFAGYVTSFRRFPEFVKAQFKIDTSLPIGDIARKFGAQPTLTWKMRDTSNVVSSTMLIIEGLQSNGESGSKLSPGEYLIVFEFQGELDCGVDGFDTLSVRPLRELKCATQAGNQAGKFVALARIVPGKSVYTLDFLAAALSVAGYFDRKGLAPF